MKTIKIISNTFLSGELLSAGKIIELDDMTANLLVDNYKAEYCKPTCLSVARSQGESAPPHHPDIEEEKRTSLPERQTRKNRKEK